MVDLPCDRFFENSFPILTLHIFIAIEPVRYFQSHFVKIRLTEKKKIINYR